MNYTGKDADRSTRIEIKSIKHFLFRPERYKLRELIEYCLRYMRRKSIITPLTPDVM